jgi:hypothetical protein
VSAVDADGNEIAGIRMPPIAVPLGTHTGWNLYRAQPVELADRDGSLIPFALTRAERQVEATDDPRPPIEERYGSGQNYVPDTKSCGPTNSAAVPLFGCLIPLIGCQNSAVRQRSGICVGLEWNQLLATLYFGLWRA